MLEYVGAWTIHQPPTLYMHLLMQIVEFFFSSFFLQGKLNKENISWVKQIKFKESTFQKCKINLKIWWRKG